MTSAATSVPAYLREVFGIPKPVLKEWPQSNKLPYFLRDAFEFRETKLLGESVVLAVARDGRNPSLSEVAKWLSQVGAAAGGRVAYVVNALASYERRRLIEQKVPFIVPGNQLYLPDLGLDLREHFRKRAQAAGGALSPSTQALLIAALLRPQWQDEWHPSPMAEELGYTPMTVSRVVRELAAAELATVSTVGRSRWLQLGPAPEPVWKKATPLLRTPVKREIWVVPKARASKVQRRLAGLSALAHRSMLVAPEWPVLAVAPPDWKAAVAAGITELPEPTAGAERWQLWSYSPALLPDAETVDPLSLMLSLQDDTDDRVQMALDELKEQLPW